MGHILKKAARMRKQIELLAVIHTMAFWDLAPALHGNRTAIQDGGDQ